MTKVPRHERVRIHPYVDRELAKRLAEYGAASGIASSAVVQTRFSSTSIAQAIRRSFCVVWIGSVAPMPVRTAI